MKTMSNALALAACAWASAACSGENRFTGPATGVENRPQLVAVGTPASVSRNEVLRLDVTATSREGITALDVVLSEGLVRDTTVAFDPPESDLDAVVEFGIPETVTIGSTIRVRVTVTDELGATSDAVEREVPVVEDEGGT